MELIIFNKNPQASVDWFDPFVGVIYSRPLASRFFMSLRGDVGGGKSDLAVNAEAMFRYQVNKTFAAKFGYRYLKVQFGESDFLYDLSLDGFLIGLGIAF